MSLTKTKNQLCCICAADAKKLYEGNPYCLSCCVNALIAAVERLNTMYVYVLSDPKLE